VMMMMRGGEETRTPRSTFFVAQATNPDENEDENEA
jgi:hypothetical protein